MLPLGNDFLVSAFLHNLNRTFPHATGVELVDSDTENKFDNGVIW